MAQLRMEDLLTRCGSVYKLVILAAKRAKELAEGAPPLVKADTKKVTSLALQEIRQGKVFVEGMAQPAEKKSKGRAKTKEKRGDA